MVHATRIDTYITFAHSDLGISKDIGSKFSLNRKLKAYFWAQHIGKIHSIEYIMNLGIDVPMSQGTLL